MFTSLFFDFRTGFGVAEGGAGGGIIPIFPFIPGIPGTEFIIVTGGGLLLKSKGVSIGLDYSFFFSLFLSFLSLYFLFLDLDLYLEEDSLLE